jgi:cytochrome c oxidase assembly factor CtaG
MEVRQHCKEGGQGAHDGCLSINMHTALHVWLTALAHVSAVLAEPAALLPAVVHTPCSATAASICTICVQHMCGTCMQPALPYAVFVGPCMWGYG